MQTAAFISGLALGIVALLSVCVVLVFRDKQLGIGGAVVAVVGLVLVGMSVWGQVKIKVSETGLEVGLVREVAEAVRTVAAEVDAAAQAQEVSRQQFVALTQELQQNRVLPTSAMQSIRSSLESIPSVDRARLETARAQLDPERLRKIYPR